MHALSLSRKSLNEIGAAKKKENQKEKSIQEKNEIRYQILPPLIFPVPHRKPPEWLYINSLISLSFTTPFFRSMFPGIKSQDSTKKYSAPSKKQCAASCAKPNKPNNPCTALPLTIIVNILCVQEISQRDRIDFERSPNPLPFSPRKKTLLGVDLKPLLLCIFLKRILWMYSVYIMPFSQRMALKITRRDKKLGKKLFRIGNIRSNYIVRANYQTTYFVLWCVHIARRTKYNA